MYSISKYFNQFDSLDFENCDNDHKVLKRILNIGKSLDGYILILDLLNLNFRKVKIKKRINCFCK